MKVKAKVREFNIFSLFLHESNDSDVSPFDQLSLERWLNEHVSSAFPDVFVQFVSPMNSSLGQWNVRFNENAYDYGDDGRNNFDTYPMPRVYDDKAFRKLIPAKLKEVLLELNKIEIDL